MTGEAKSLVRHVQSSDRCKLRLDVDFPEGLIALLLRQQQQSASNLAFFERTRPSLLRRCRLCVEIGDRAFEHLI